MLHRRLEKSSRQGWLGVTKGSEWSTTTELLGKTSKWRRGEKMVQVFGFDALAARSRDHLANSAPAQICLSNDLRDFAALWPRSDRLGAARCYVFQCADILELKCDTFAIAQSAEPLFVAILGHAADPLLLVPLSMEGHHPNRVLKFLDGGLSDYNAPVLFPPVANWDAKTMRMIWRSLRKLLPPFDIAVFDRMPDRVDDLPNPLSLLSTSAHGESGHAAHLYGTWEDFARKLPRRREMRLKARRLGKIGNMTFEIASNPEQYEVFLETLIRQKRQRYFKTWEKQGLDRLGYRAYLTKAKRLLYPTGPVCLFALKVNETIIATAWGYVVGRRFYTVLQSFETGWDSYSPGHVLFEELFKWCFAQGLGAFDLGVGDEKYKDEYCDIRIILREAVIPATVLRWTRRWIGNNIPFVRHIYNWSRSDSVAALPARDWDRECEES